MKAQHRRSRDQQVHAAGGLGWAKAAARRLRFKQPPRGMQQLSPPEALAPHAILVCPRGHSRSRAVERSKHGAQGAARGAFWRLLRLRGGLRRAEEIQELGGNPARFRT